MKRLFADSFFFIALLNERDACHDRAAQVSRQSGAFIVTTRWVLAEVADALSAPAWRRAARAFVEFVLTAPGFLVESSSDDFSTRGMELYRSPTLLCKTRACEPEGSGSAPRRPPVRINGIMRLDHLRTVPAYASVLYENGAQLSQAA